MDHCNYIIAARGNVRAAENFKVIKSLWIDSRGFSFVHGSMAAGKAESAAEAHQRRQDRHGIAKPARFRPAVFVV